MDFRLFIPFHSRSHQIEGAFWANQSVFCFFLFPFPAECNPCKEGFHNKVPLTFSPIDFSASAITTLNLLEKNSHILPFFQTLSEERHTPARQAVFSMKYFSSANQPLQTVRVGQWWSYALRPLHHSLWFSRIFWFVIYDILEQPHHWVNRCEKESHRLPLILTYMM